MAKNSRWIRTLVFIFLAIFFWSGSMLPSRVQSQGPPQGRPPQGPPEGLPPERRIPVDDLLPNPHRRGPRIQDMRPQSTFYGLTDCMNGDVLMRAVFVDSDGTPPPNGDGINQYNWSWQEIDSAVQKIQSEYDFSWSILAPRYGRQVKFYVEKNVVAVPYEPVRHEQQFKGWVRAALSTLLNQPVCDGCESGAAEQYAYNGLTVNQFNRTLNRATVIFFVANSGEFFADNGRSFAYLGGPYSVVERVNSSYAIQETTIHETGHLFWALDEYSSYCGDPRNLATCSDAPPKRPCETDQFTPEVNGNCEACNPNSTLCVMKYISPKICGFTAPQISWNGTPLTPPEITRVKCKNCTAGGKLVVKGIGLDPTCVVLADRVELPTSYRSDYQDLIVRNSYLPEGVREFRVRRYSDVLVSDPYFKEVTIFTNDPIEGMSRRRPSQAQK
ncbi:MAG TPA: hypothetical protein VNN73_06010 [Blastocatellia bacterium]|nr:hypothetical protein [Blastocatellia bacterium]